tara:strand:- start:380 stop:586 length:207 start_codon:yes stop_codon:yes gene_type:complete
MPTINRTEDLTQEELEKLGCEISQTCLWNGEDILTVFKSALEDANFHSFNESVSELWEKELLKWEKQQ